MSVEYIDFLIFKLKFVGGILLTYDKRTVIVPPPRHPCLERKILYGL